MWGAFVVLCIVGFSIAGASAIVKYVDSSKECTENTDCGDLNYCGADFKCHEHPTITQNITDLTTPAIILAIGIVAAALIWRKK